MHTLTQTTTRGFTLIELAIVLVVVGLLAGLLMAPLSARIEAHQRHLSETALNEAIDALTGLALIQRRLPCPATNNSGIEQSPPCATTGYLPWRTLGLEENAAIRYRPDRAFTEGSIGIASTPASNIYIRDHAGAAVSTVESRVVAIVLVPGINMRPDGANATTANGPIFEAGEPTPDFDDQVRWISHPVLIAHLVRAGRL